MGCRGSVSGMLKIPNADYLIITGLATNLTAVEELKRNKYTELLERYKIKEGTCAAALLDEISTFTPFEGDTDEILPYHGFFHGEKFGRWSKSTITKNIRRLADLDVIQLRYWDDIDEGKRRYILKIEDIVRKKSGISLKKIFSKVIVPMGRLSKIDFDELDGLYEDALFIPRLLGYMFGATEDEIGLISEHKFILKEDVRGLSLHERTAKLMEVYRKFVKPRNHAKNRNGYEERRRVTTECAELFQSAPHIKDVNVTGSLSIGDDEERSDIDLLLCRYECPGKEECLEKLPKQEILVDIFCFTQEETEELRQAGALVTYLSTPYSQWKENELEVVAT